MAQENGLLLEVKNITKTFPGVRALNNVNFSLHKGKVHALVGQNGAGKSTLIKIMSGVYQPDEGEMFLEGSHVHLPNPRRAHEMGIFTIHQELSLAQHLSVAENVFLGMKKPKRFGKLFINWGELHARTSGVMQRLGLEIDPAQDVRSLNIGEQQLVEIAKGFLTESKVLILDEPTSALSLHEIEYLFKIINNLKGHGIGIIYISHRLEEIFEIADTVTVLRDGDEIITTTIDQLDYDGITAMMIGRDLSSVDRETFRARKSIGKEILRAEQLRAARVNDVSFSLKEGEILGLAGLMGAGRSEIVRVIYGTLEKESGSIYLEGDEVDIKSPGEALKNGIGYTTEDRKNEGLFLDQSVRSNLTIAILKDLAIRGWLGKKEKGKAEQLVRDYNVVTPSLSREIKFLSGGNQQKVIIARTLASKLKVIILDEPTKGIDVGAKQEVFKLVRDLADSGLAVIFISSELSEVVDVADRILIIKDGRIISELARAEATKQKVLERILRE
jgi:ABC-type sugar transport system ATPase subunit